MNILVVEDDADLCVEIVEYLERRNHRVSGCGTMAVARQALAALVAKSELDGVVCDVGLPDGDGLRLYTESDSESVKESSSILTERLHETQGLGVDPAR